MVYASVLYLAVNMFKISSINLDLCACAEVSVQCMALENLGEIDNWLCMIDCLQGLK